MRIALRVLESRAHRTGAGGSTLTGIQLALGWCMNQKKEIDQPQDHRRGGQAMKHTNASSHLVPMIEERLPRISSRRTVRALLILALGVGLLVLPTQGVLAAKNTNDDRKTECKRNLNGEVVENSDGGFTCNSGSYEASIHCTSGGRCACTGADCNKIGGNGALERTSTRPGQLERFTAVASLGTARAEFQKQKKAKKPPPKFPVCSVKAEPDIATDGQRVYLDPVLAFEDMRAVVTGNRYNDAPPSATRRGEGREQTYCGCQRVRLEIQRDPDGVEHRRPYVLVPLDAPSGDYAIQLLPADGECPRGGIRSECLTNGCSYSTLKVVPSYVVSTTNRIHILNNSEDNDDHPAEMQFFFAGTSGEAFAVGEDPQALVRWSGAFPGGEKGSAHITNDDRSEFYGKIPLFVGAENLMTWNECREECYSKPRFDEVRCLENCDYYKDLRRFDDTAEFAISGIEYDGSPSKAWGIAAGIAAAGLGCYLQAQAGLPSCVSEDGGVAALSIASNVEAAVNDALENKDDPLGTVSERATSTNNWRTGSVVGPIQFEGEGAGGHIQLYYENTRMGAPRILKYRLRLKSIRLEEQYEACSGPTNEVYVNARVGLSDTEQLPDVRRFPDRYWELVPGETENFGGIPYPVGGAEYAAESAPESPFLYVELGFWEYDGGDHDLFGVHVDTIPLASVLASGSGWKVTDESTAEGQLVRRVQVDRKILLRGDEGSDNHCFSWDLGGVRPDPHGRRGAITVQYEIEIVSLKYPLGT